jgi:transcription elongation factor Elf1
MGRMELEEIKAIYGAFKTCPRCGSNEGFWLCVKPEAKCMQCKHCGAIFEICEVFSAIEGKGKSVAGKISIFRKIR